METSPGFASRPLQNELVPAFLGESAKDGVQKPARGRAIQHPDVAGALLADAFRARASDIHLEPGMTSSRVRFRIDGTLWDAAEIGPDAARLLVNQFKVIASLDPVVGFTPRDAHAVWSSPDGRLDLRLALAPCLNGEALSIRLLDPKRLERSIKELGLDDYNLRRLEDWVEHVNGMFLAAGPTGSGKTTTLYALLHELKFANRAVISLEDPIEYRVDGTTQIQIDRLHNLSFAEGVKAMLRLDPDHLMLGEIRESASAHAAVNAAISGRVLLSTVHCPDAVGAVAALRNWGLADHEIAESLAVVVAQRLVRKLCPACRKETVPTEGERMWLESFGMEIPARSWKAAGCERCNQFGYYERTGIFELWRLDEKDYAMILAHADENAIRRHLASRGHSTFLRTGLVKASQGVTSIAELRRSCGGRFPSQQAGTLSAATK